MTEMYHQLIVVSTLLISLTIFVSALEHTKNRWIYEQGSWLDWPLNKYAYCINIPWLDRVLTATLFSARNINYARICGAILLLPAIHYDVFLPLILSILFILQIVYEYRTPIGRDGSDQMVSIVLFGLALITWNHDSLMFIAGVSFLSAQIILSYMASGWAKITSPVWRKENAMAGIFNTKTYGRKFVAEILRKYPFFSRSSAYFVMLWQGTFLLAVVAPDPIDTL